MNFTSDIFSSKTIVSILTIRYTIYWLNTYNAIIATIANVSTQEMFEHEAQRVIECTGALNLFSSQQDTVVVCLGFSSRSNILLHLEYKVFLCEPKIEFNKLAGGKALATDHREMADNLCITFFNMDLT